MRLSDRYSTVERALHYLAFSVPFVQKALAELENDLFARNRDRSRSEREVFITGLPRAGTTLLLDLPANARALREETFGPLLPIIRVSDEAQMIAMANDSDFGLSASVWTRDRARGRAIAQRLDAGTVVSGRGDDGTRAPLR